MSCDSDTKLINYEKFVADVFMGNHSIRGAGECFFFFFFFFLCQWTTIDHDRKTLKLGMWLVSTCPFASFFMLQSCKIKDCSFSGFTPKKFFKSLMTRFISLSAGRSELRPFQIDETFVLLGKT